jgi:hypothetical protein
MKVTGPHQGTGAPGAAPDAADGTDKVAGKPGAGAAAKPEETGKVGGATTGRSFAETLAAGRVAPATGAQAPAAVQAPPAIQTPDALTADIAADLKAGKLDAKAALDRVVERVIDRQIGPSAPAALRDQLRDALRDTISSDPLIAERLRGLS